MPKLIDLTGRVFGRLTVVRRSFTKKGKVYWICQCECGNERSIAGCSLKLGLSSSCGCFRKELLGNITRKHGLRETKAYRILYGAIDRCTNPKNRAWVYYGGRGIRVSEAWMRNPVQFIADMGQPKDGYTLERVDVNGHYEPGNCVWATKKQQARNKRTTRLVTYQGETRSLAEWSEILGVNYSALRFRLDDGWPVDRAFTAPYRQKHKNSISRR